VDGTVHTAPTCQCRIGGITDRLSILLSDIALYDFQNGLMNGYFHLPSLPLSIAFQPWNYAYQKELTSSIG
jgi:hypothetical protein